jgi:hypothetical protein
MLSSSYDPKIGTTVPLNHLAMEVAVNDSCLALISLFMQQNVVGLLYLIIERIKCL